MMSKYFSNLPGRDMALERFNVTKDLFNRFIPRMHPPERAESHDQ